MAEEMDVDSYNEEDPRDDDDDDDKKNRRRSSSCGLLLWREKMVDVIKAGRKSYFVDGCSELALCVLIADGERVEAYRMAEAKELGEFLSGSMAATRELASASRTPKYHHSTSRCSSFVGVAYFFDGFPTRSAAIAVVENKSDDLVGSFGRAQRVAETVARDRAIEASLFSLQMENSVPKCSECGRRHAENIVRACPGRSCGAPLCCRQSCRRCDSLSVARQAVLDNGLDRLQTLGEMFGDLSVDGRLSRTGFEKLMAVAYCIEDDPCTEDAFDAADSDSDGYVDFEDVCRWLTKQLPRDDATEDDAAGREDLVEWPSFSAPRAKALDRVVDVRLENGKLTLNDVVTATVHPSAMSVRRTDDLSLELSNRLTGKTLRISFQRYDACRDAVAAFSETLAICRRLGRPLVEFKGECNHLSKRKKGDPLAEAMADLFASPPPAPRRRSTRFSDVDEVVVNKGWAFDRVTTASGEVRWEAAAPRRAKEAYRAVVKLVIRPPRAEYDATELGPRAFVVNGTQCVRSDFFVEQTRKGRNLACSLWRRLDEATQPCVLYAHGNASCRLEALPHVGPLLLLGISVCAFDTSGSGHSDGDFVSLGERESGDCAQVCRRLVETQRASSVAIFGRSMGAVAAVLSAARHGLACCVVADSPFASLEALVNDLAQSAAATAFSAPPPSSQLLDDDDDESSSWFSFLESLSPLSGARSALAEAAATAAVESVRSEVEKRGGFQVADVDTLGAVKTLDIPLLLVASEEDGLVPAKTNAAVLLDAYTKGGGEVALYMCPGGHNAKRPPIVNRKIYYFLLRQLSKRDPDTLKQRIKILNPYVKHLAAQSPPWNYTKLDTQRNHAHKQKTNNNNNGRSSFVSGMSESRQARATREISNLFQY